MRRRVVIVQRRLTHYRLPLFESLRAQLAARDIELRLLVGQATAAEASKRDGGSLPWAVSLPTYYFAGGRLCWQAFGRQLEGADLLVVTQENKLINNHLLALGPRRFRLAFWGHGANLQSDKPGGLREGFKRWTSNRVDWWFAYTQISADLVAAAGFARERITVLNNAVDTSALKRHRDELGVDERARLRAELGFAEGRVGAFIGSLYADKRIDVLLAAADLIRSQLGDFHLLIIGDGPLAPQVQAWCASRPWARWVGARTGREKVAYLSTATVMLNPGLVGLGILDSFALGLPMLTTRSARHSPEIAYLRDGENGLMSDDGAPAYAQATVALLRDTAALSRVSAACLASGEEYTLDHMTGRFCAGIDAALGV